MNSLVSPGCVTKGHVENSILSFGVRVEEQAVVRNTMVVANNSVGYHSVVDCCVLDAKGWTWVSGVISVWEQVSFLGIVGLRCWERV